MSGALHLTAPAGWTLNPPTFSFNLNAGEKFDQPVTIEFPYNSLAGHKTLDFGFVLTGEKNPTFTVPLALQLGLSDLGMRTVALRDGRDVFVDRRLPTMAIIRSPIPRLPCIPISQDRAPGCESRAGRNHHPEISLYQCITDRARGSASRDEGTSGNADFERFCGSSIGRAFFVAWSLGGTGASPVSQICDLRFAIEFNCKSQMHG